MQSVNESELDLGYKGMQADMYGGWDLIPQEDLYYCDICGHSEIDDILKDVSNELIKMYKADDGCIICEKCNKE